MAEKLDKERIRQLLEEADQKWFKNHSGEFKYLEHLEFVAEHLARHYRDATTGNQRAVSGTLGKRKNRGQ